MCLAAATRRTRCSRGTSIDVERARNSRKRDHCCRGGRRQLMKQSIYLVDGNTQELVEAEMTSFQRPERLIEIEASWNTLRDWSLFKPSTRGDWNWINKRASIVTGIGILCEIECQNEPQGAIKLDGRPRSSRLDAGALCGVPGKCSLERPTRGPWYATKIHGSWAISHCRGDSD